jgi:hypothetical protein
MHDLIPSARILYLVRDPIERIVSHYMHNRVQGRETRAIDKVLSGDLEENHYVYCSRYNFQLEQYRNYYSEDQILVIPSKQLYEHRQSTVKEVLRFLGVDSPSDPPELDREYGQTEGKTVRTPLGEVFSGTAIVQFGKKLIPTGLEDPFRALLKRPAQKPTVSGDLRKRLEDALREDANRLRSKTGLALEHWSV